MRGLGPRLGPVLPAHVATTRHLCAAYPLVAEAEKDYAGYWARLARELITWKTPFTKTLDESQAPFFKWFHDGELNASYNCLDRHLATQPDKTAIIFEADDRVGGMTATFDFGGLDIERYYHFHCLSDSGFLRMLEELGLSDQLHWRQTRMGFYIDGRLLPWGTVGSVLTFRRLPWLTRIRYLLHAARCLTIRDWRPLDDLTATDWLRAWLGERGYQVLWHKLFAFKFFHYSDQISAAWIWMSTA